MKNIVSDDREIWKSIQMGHEDAFNDMFMRYYSPLCEYASQYISDADAEELVQDMMIYLWENRTEVFVQKSLRSYLFSSVKNRCYNSIRSGQAKAKVHDHIYECLKTRLECPDYYFLNGLSHNIDMVIDSFPEKYRETFCLSRFGEMSNAEIAEQLGISVKTVEYRISRCLRILRCELKDYLPVVVLLLNLGFMSRSMHGDSCGSFEPLSSAALPYIYDILLDMRISGRCTCPQCTDVRLDGPGRFDDASGERRGNAG